MNLLCLYPGPGQEERKFHSIFLMYSLNESFVFDIWKGEAVSPLQCQWRGLARWWVSYARPLVCVAAWLTSVSPLFRQFMASSGLAAMGIAAPASRLSSWCSRSWTATRPSHLPGLTTASAQGHWVRARAWDKGQFNPGEG